MLAFIHTGYLVNTVIIVMQILFPFFYLCLLTKVNMLFNQST